MNKKKLSIIALIMCLVVVFLAAVLVACDPKSGDDGTTDSVEATEGLLIANSDFKVIGASGDFPRTITNWTGAKLYSSSSVHGDVIAGAVNLTAATYEQYRSLWKDDDNTVYNLLTAGGHYGADDEIKNALMIYMPTEDEVTSEDEDYGPTAYGYTASSFTIEKNSYYKLSVDVLTYDIAGTDKEGNEPGARIYVSSNTYAEIAAIDTKGQWVTYEIYIEGAADASNTLTVNFALGKYSSYYTDGLTTGYAFFDNVTLEKLADDTDESGAVTTTAAEKYAEAVKRELKQYEDNKNDAASPVTVATATLKLPNARFEFGSTSISSSTAPSNWSVVRGNSSESDPAPSSDRFNGIVDLDTFKKDYSSYISSTYYLRDSGTISKYSPATQLAGIADTIGERDGIYGSGAYLVSQQLMTAQGIKSSRKIVIEKNKYYVVSIDLYLVNIYGAGATLRLSGDGEDIEIKGIASKASSDTVEYGSAESGASSAGWTTYTFVIHGNQYRDMSYNMEIWLGTEGTSSNTSSTYTKFTSTTSSGSSATTYTADGTFSTGWMFIDNLTLAETDEEGFDSAVANATDFTLDAAGSTDAQTVKVDLATDNLFSVSASAGTGIDGEFNPDGSDAYSTGSLGLSAGITFSASTADNPAVVDASFVRTGVVNAATGEGLPEGVDAPLTPYATESDFAFMLYSSKSTSFAYNTDEFEIVPNTFYRASLWVKTEDIKSGKGAYVYVMQKGEKDGDDPVELASFTSVNTSEVEDNNGWTEITVLFRGDVDYKTGTEGEKVFLRLALGTGDRYAATTLTSGAAFVTNMSLTEITYSDYNGTSTGTYIKKVDFSTTSSNSFTNGAFDNIDFAEDEALSSGGVLLQDSNAAGVPADWTLSDKTLDDNFVGGIIKFNSDGTASTQIDNLFGNGYAFFNPVYPVGTDDVIAAGGPNMLVLAGKGGNKYSVGYTSDSFTLTASTNYTISVWARAEVGTKGMIYLAGEASGSERDGNTLYFVVEGDGAWHRYTFNIRVGLTSVSLELGLWLGENADITGAVVGDGEGQVAEDSLKSSGVVVFDSVTMRSTLTDEDFEDGAADGYTRYIDFNSDSFDTLTDTSDNRGELTSPENWTSAVGTDQSSADTTSGVLYLDKDGGYVDLTDDGYISLFDPDIDIDNFVIDDAEVDSALASGEYADRIDEIMAEGEYDTERDALIYILKKDKYDALMKDLGVTWDDILPDAGVGPDGNRILVVNNTANSAFYYYSSNYTLSADKAYKISVRVYTHGIGHIEELSFEAADDLGAYVELYLGTYNDSSSPLRLANLNPTAAEGWQTVTFYVMAPAEDVTGVQLRLGLGLYDAENPDLLLGGYAFFDAVTFEEISVSDYENAKESIADGDKYNAAYNVPEAPESGDTSVDNDPETPENTFNLDNLWWMIPTILLALATIAVVIVFFVKKYGKKFAKKAGEEEAPVEKENLDNVNRKKNNYDDFNE